MIACPRRRYQFTSRALVLLMLLLSPPLGYVAKVKYDSAQFRRAQQEVSKRFDVQVASDTKNSNQFANAVQLFVDRDAYSETPFIRWNGDHHVGPDVVTLISKLRGVQSVHFTKHDILGKQPTRARVNWTDSDLAQFGEIHTLQSIAIDGVYSTSAVESLLRLPLYQLLLPETRIDVRLARKVRQCESLSSIGFDFQDASPEAIRCVIALPHLSHLTLRHAAAGQDIYTPMIDCHCLKALLIYDSSLTADDGQAIAKLRLKQVRLVNCLAQPGFFMPLQNSDTITSIIISHESHLSSFYTDASSIAEMEAQFTTTLSNARVADPSPRFPALLPK